MPSITIRNIPEPVHRRLRIRAAKNGRSMEAELRVILAIVTGAGRRKPDQKPANGPEMHDSVSTDLTCDDLVLFENDALPNQKDAIQKVRAILKARAVEEAA